MASIEVVVIGGGAAGFFGAIHAAKAAHTRVNLLEACLVYTATLPTNRDV